LLPARRVSLFYRSRLLFTKNHKRHITDIQYSSALGATIFAPSLRCNTQQAAGATIIASGHRDAREKYSRIGVGRMKKIRAGFPEEFPTISGKYSCRDFSRHT
jgi:hypothetical protein